MVELLPCPRLWATKSFTLSVTSYCTMWEPATVLCKLPAYKRQRTKMRSAPLWGLRTRTRFIHDFESLTLESAIRRHRGEAQHVAERFDDLTPTEKQQLITFLNSL